MRPKQTKPRQVICGAVTIGRKMIRDLIGGCRKQGDIGADVVPLLWGDKRYWRCIRCREKALEGFSGTDLHDAK